MLPSRKLLSLLSFLAVQTSFCMDVSDGSTPEGRARTFFRVWEEFEKEKYEEAQKIRGEMKEKTLQQFGDHIVVSCMYKNDSKEERAIVPVPPSAGWGKIDSFIIKEVRKSLTKIGAINQNQEIVIEYIHRPSFEDSLHNCFADSLSLVEMFGPQILAQNIQEKLSQRLNELDELETVITIKHETDQKSRRKCPQDLSQSWEDLMMALVHTKFGKKAFVNMGFKIAQSKNLKDLSMFDRSRPEGYHNYLNAINAIRKFHTSKTIFGLFLDSASYDNEDLKKTIRVLAEFPSLWGLKVTDPDSALDDPGFKVFSKNRSKDFSFQVLYKMILDRQKDLGGGKKIPAIDLRTVQRMYAISKRIGQQKNFLNLKWTLSKEAEDFLKKKKLALFPETKDPHKKQQTVLNKGDFLLYSTNKPQTKLEECAGYSQPPSHSPQKQSTEPSNLLNKLGDTEENFLNKMHLDKIFNTRPQKPMPEGKVKTAEEKSTFVLQKSGKVEKLLDVNQDTFAQEVNEICTAVLNNYQKWGKIEGTRLTTQSRDYYMYHPHQKGDYEGTSLIVHSTGNTLMPWDYRAAFSIIDDQALEALKKRLSIKDYTKLYSFYTDCKKRILFLEDLEHKETKKK